MTNGTRLLFRARLRARAAAGRTGPHVADLDDFRDAARDLLERERKTDLERIAAALPRSARTALFEHVAEPAHPTAATTEVAHERAQRVGEIEAGEVSRSGAATAPAAERSRSRMAEAVVLRPLVRVVENLV